MRKNSYEVIVSYVTGNQKAIYRLAYTYTKNQEDALDVVQNTIIKALESYELLKNADAVKTWVYRIAVNESISYMRKNRKDVLTDENFDLEAASVYEEKGYDMHDDLYDAINMLPADVQTIIKLRYYEDMEISEIALIMKQNINTVKAKLYRGLKALRQEIDEREEN